MADLLERLLRHGPGGIPHADAKQLMLWLYCSTSVLPEPIRGQAPNREQLIAMFSELTERGVIAVASQGVGPPATQWAHLLDDLLSSEVALDKAFFERAKAYLGP